MARRLRLPRLTAIGLLAGAFLLAAAGISSAQDRRSAPIRGTAPDTASGEEEVEEEVEWEWEEGEEEEFQVGEDGELEPIGDEEAEEATASRAPLVCAVDDIAARVTASHARDTVRLAVRYAASEPVGVTVHAWLKSGRGALWLRPFRLHVGRRGTVETRLRLNGLAMARVRAARVFLVYVEARPAGTCEQHLIRRLSARQRGLTRTTWSERLGPAFQSP
jgi:hypothetical protein